MLSEDLTIDLKGCARCGGDGHPKLTFTQLTNPVVDDDGTTYGFWAPCPTNGEPILLKSELKTPGRRAARVLLGPGEYACIITEQLASSFRVWSEPVQIMAEPSRDLNPDVVEIVARVYECTRKHIDDNF